MPPGTLAELLGLGPITTEFGEPSAFSGQPHTGIDVAVPTGTPLQAPVGGRVTRVFSDTLGGLQVVVQTAAGFSQTFAHLSHASVKQGDEIAAGDVVALSGASGKVTGAHVHYEVRSAEGAAVNPRTFLGEFADTITGGGGTKFVEASSSPAKVDACASIPASTMTSIRQWLDRNAAYGGNDPKGTADRLRKQFADVPLECLQQIVYGKADELASPPGSWQETITTIGGFLVDPKQWAKIAFTAAGAGAILLGVLLYTRTLTALPVVGGAK